MVGVVLHVEPDERLGNAEENSVLNRRTMPAPTELPEGVESNVEGGPEEPTVRSEGLRTLDDLGDLPLDLPLELGVELVLALVVSDVTNLLHLGEVVSRVI